MKIEAISIYGSAGSLGGKDTAIVNAHLVIDGCQTVAQAKALLYASAQMQDTLEMVAQKFDHVPQDVLEYAALRLGVMLPECLPFTPAQAVQIRAALKMSKGC